MGRPGFGAPTLGSFSWSMGPFADRFGMRDWLFENVVHHFDLARFFFGELSDVHVVRGPGREHTVVVSATSESGAVISIRANTTGSWEQRNEAVEIFGEGHSLYVDNLDTCTYRPPERPEQVWRPNYTVPVSANMTGATMGFVRELEHFREVLAEGATCRVGHRERRRDARPHGHDCEAGDRLIRSGSGNRTFRSDRLTWISALGADAEVALTVSSSLVTESSRRDCTARERHALATGCGSSQGHDLEVHQVRRRSFAIRDRDVPGRS